MVVPLRPNGKDDIHEPLASCAHPPREDGLPVAPWLPVEVSQALTPVACDVEHGTAVYIEPNVCGTEPGCEGKVA